MGGDSGSPPKIQGGDALIFIMEILKINGDKVDASRCDPATLEECDDRESKYINKMKAKPDGKISSEIKRLTGMKGKQMKPKLQHWLERRLTILSQMAKNN